MRLLHKIILISVCLILPVQSYCQHVAFNKSFRLNDNHHLSNRDVYTLQSMGMICTPPAGFYGSNNLFKYKYTPSFKDIGSFIESSIESKERDFAVLYYIDDIFNKEDSISALFIKKFKMDINRLHLNQLKIPEVNSIRYHSKRYARKSLMQIRLLCLMWICTVKSCLKNLR